MRDEVPANLPWRRTITPDPVSLFRFSAITFNPHRIHYDRPYAMETEGYPGLVVHGPFTQLCLTNFVRDNNPGRADPHLRHARAGAAVRHRAVRPGGPADRGRQRLRGVGGDAQWHHRHAGDRDVCVRQAPTPSPSPQGERGESWSRG